MGRRQADERGGLYDADTELGISPWHGGGICFGSIGPDNLWVFRMTERPINRWVVIPSKDTPLHISQIRVFDSEDQAISHAHLTNGEVRSCLDADALSEHHRRT